MSVKISQLPSASEVLGSDVAPSVQDGTTKKFSMTTLANYLLNTFNSLSLGGTARTVKSAIDAIYTSLSSLLAKVGNVTMGTTATTITGAIAEHEGDITTINASLSSLTARAGSTLSNPLSLSTTPQLVNCGGLSYNVGGVFTLVSDGGFRCSKQGRVRVHGFIHVTGVTSGDEIALAAGVYSGGWVYESYSARSKTITALLDIYVPVNANQTVYIRASNNSGIRGSVDSAQLSVEFLA